MKTLPSRALLFVAPCLLVPGLSGCGLLKTAVETPGRITSAALGSDEKPPVDPNRAQARLRRFADLFAVEIREATRQFAERAGTTEAHVQALTWRLDYTNTAWRIAAGPQPFAALFDMLVAVTALRIVHEERWAAEWGESNRAMVEALVRLEDGVWALAGEGLTKAQVEKVREIVATWEAGDPEMRIVDIARLPGFVDLASTSEGDEKGLVDELTGLMSIDPLSGLEPAVREVEQTRQLAERAFYFLQRLPELLSGRVELMALRSVHNPEVSDLLTGWERVSGAAASLAGTAEDLPAAVAAEREAALTQISTELTRQREGLVRDLETAREPLVELLVNARGTAESGRAMSDALTGTLRAFDQMMERFKPSDGPGAETSAAEAPGTAPAAPEAPEEEGPPKRPFDITEYGNAAEQIGVAARELGVTIATLERSLPEVRQVLDEAAARAEEGVDHAFVRALELLAAGLAGGALVFLLVRRISWRWRQEGRRADA